MATSIRLRPWQRLALDTFRTTERPDFLAVATPGAGKTTFALTAAAQALAAGQARGLVVVAPTQHLKVQWAEAAARFGLALEPDWSARDGRLPSDMHGVVTTYQQVATSSAPLRKLTSGAFVVLDEIHHAGDDRAWGAAVLEAFEPAARRLSLSGTPFRSDTSAIPFVEYHLDEARADFEYGYGDALSDGGVVRPVYFPRIGGHMEWIAPDGSEMSAAFDDELDTQGVNQRLRTALSLEGQWLSTVLADANDQLRRIRQTQPDAGGLVIAMDQAHADGIARLLRKYGSSPTVAVSDDPDASAKIARFATSAEPWIVAVRMVSEGVDIPRLRLGVFATNTTTELFFRQAVGRLVRWTPGRRAQRAYLFIPDDPRLRTWASSIADTRRHSLTKRRGDGEDRFATDELDDRDRTEHAEDDGEQLSMFAVISAVAGEAHEPIPELFAEDPSEPWGEVAPDGYEVHLTVPPLPGGGDGSAAPTRAAQKRDLRAANAVLATELVHVTGMSHRAVNAELNRLAGITRITEATVVELERRRVAGERWLRNW